jgi:EmrB/QacA subfamily drug resistance transporter
MPQREEEGHARFDWIGFALLACTLSCLLTALSSGQREGWSSDYIFGLTSIALVAGLAFLVWELKTPQPLVNLRVLKNGQFACAAVIACLFGVGLFGSTYLVPLFVQTVQGYTAFTSGLLLMPGGLIMGLFMPIGGFMSDRLPARGLIIAGLLCFILSSYWLATVDVNSGFWMVASSVIVSRIGLALIKPTLNVTALRAIRPELLGQGAGMINFARQLGGAFGVNLLSVMLDRRTAFHGDVYASMQTAANSATADLLRSLKLLLAQGGLPPELQTAAAMNFLGKVTHMQAYTSVGNMCEA